MKKNNTLISIFIGLVICLNFIACDPPQPTKENIALFVETPVLEQDDFWNILKDKFIETGYEDEKTLSIDVYGIGSKATTYLGNIKGSESGDLGADPEKWKGIEEFREGIKSKSAYADGINDQNFHILSAIESIYNIINRMEKKDSLQIIFVSDMIEQSPVNPNLDYYIDFFDPNDGINNLAVDNAVGFIKNDNSGFFTEFIKPFENSKDIIKQKELKLNIKAYPAELARINDNQYNRLGKFWRELFSKVFGVDSEFNIQGIKSLNEK